MKLGNSIPSIIVKLLLLFSFIMPINQRVSTIILIIICVLSLWSIKEINIKLLRLFLPLLLLYFVYMVGYYRDTFSFSISMFEQKASFIAFPIIFSTIKLEKSQITSILKFFVFGCVTSYIVFSIISFYNSVTFHPFEFNTTVEHLRNNKATHDLPLLLTNNFLGKYFTFPMNGNYLSIYFSFCLAIILNLKKGFSKKFKYLAIIVLTLGVLQIFSIMGFICYVFVIGTYFSKSNYNRILLVFLSLFIVSVSFLFFNDSNFLNEEKKDITKTIEKIDNRAFIWSSAAKSIKENFIFGVGVKTAQKTLEKNYSKKGKFGFDSQVKKLDAHNMFFQILIENGISGFIILIICVILFFKHNKNNYYGKIFISLFLLLSITESTLAVYLGISFFSYFYCLFLYDKIDEKKKTITQLSYA